MFHRAITHHGHSTEETKEGFRIRTVTLQERLESWHSKKKVTLPSSEECFFLKWHYMESSGTGN